MRLIYLLSFALLLTLAVHGQDTAAHAPVFYESALRGQTRFFYDDHYFLADKTCPFKAIERVGTYDFRERMFTGPVIDFNLAGRVILRGNYRNGEKEGTFTAYHSNGQVKWEGAYAHDAPQGTWKYFYPDGKPLLEVKYGDEGVTIIHFWDRRGRQRVTDGKGTYEFAIEADGYNEYGYVRYNRKGKVVDGKPDGVWIIEYVFGDGKKEGAGHEVYEQGRFVRGYESYTDESFFDAPRYGVLPIAFFPRGEALISKECSIDEYSGFTGYLSNHLEEWFEGEADEPIDPQSIRFTVEVDRNGEPGRIVIDSTFSRKRYADLLLEGVRNIGFWFPSFTDGTFINDTLTVTMEAFPDVIGNNVRFFDVKIRREKGQ